MKATNDKTSYWKFGLLQNDEKMKASKISKKVFFVFYFM